ncbi:MAG: PhnD/SsuA/transferrin family substrate-binding protein [Verrucomicrobiota bacterium]
MRNIIIATGLALLCGCASNKPLHLKLAVNDIYCTDTACSCVHDVATRTYPQTVDKLERKYGIKLQFVYFPESYQLENAILSGEYDGAICKPWTSLMLQKMAGASFQRIVDVLDPNNNRWLSGIFVVPVDSPIQTLEELEGKHLYIGQSDAYEKHQAAKRLLAQRGIKPARIDNNASCSENVGVLLDNEADAVVLSDYTLSADCASDFASPEDFRILAHTEKIPLTSVVLDMKKVSPEDARRVQKALLSVSGIGAAKTLQSKGFVKPSPWNPPELREAP